MKIYIAGPMKGNDDYIEDFGAAEAYLRTKGWTVINPAVLPDDLDPEDYMPICLAMLERADAMVILRAKEGEGGGGAKLEAMYAAYQGKQIYHDLETVPSILEWDETEG